MSSNKYCTAILESLVTAFIQCYEARLELCGGHGEIFMKRMIQLGGPRGDYRPRQSDGCECSAF